MANNTLLASDNFASGSLAAGWAAAFGESTSIVTGGSPYVAEPTSTIVPGWQIWTGLTWPNDQSSEVTINALSALVGTSISLLVRMATEALSGYVATLVDNVATIYVYTAGTATSLVSVSGLTIAAGDVWCLQAAGASLSLYQNYKLVARFYDATYTSGTPGFAQASTTAITDSKVGSWRGYNAVQQDGIWQKQGIVIAPNATDLTISPDGQGLQTCNVIYDDNPQILAGPMVFKTWVANNWAATTDVGGVYYFESADGVNWTREATAVLTGYTNIYVTKQASTYYMYCQTNAGNGQGTIQVLTSSNGITWTLQSPSDTISLGSGTWDDSAIYEICGVQVIAGTWYGIYCATNNKITALFSTGLVTSPDGINWTKYAGNPVLANVLALSVVQVGNTYYGWFQANQPGQGNGHAPDLDPIEIVRYQTTDYINWTNPQHSLHHSEPFELVNNNAGFCIPAGILSVGSQTYLWTNVGMDGGNTEGGTTAEIGQIGLAIAPAPLSQLVTQPENAFQQLGADAFTSGVGNLDSNWATPTGSTKLQIVAGNLVEATALTTTCAMVYTSAVFSGPQYSSVTVETLDSGSYVEPIVYGQTGANSWYGINLEGPLGSAFGSQLVKRVAGSNSVFGPAVNITPQIGDVFTLSVVVNSDGFPVLSLFQNGFLIIQAQDYSSSPFTSGYPGMALYTVTNLADGQISLWAGGNANVTPSYSSGSSSSWLTVNLNNSLRGLKH